MVPLVRQNFLAEPPFQLHEQAVRALVYHFDVLKRTQLQGSLDLCAYVFDTEVLGM